MTPFLTAMHDIARQLHTIGQPSCDAAVNDMRNAVAQHFNGGALPAPASLAVVIGVSAQAIADMLLQLKPGTISPQDIAELFATELARALQRNTVQGMNGHHIGGTG